MRAYKETNRTEKKSPETDPHIYGSLIYDKTGPAKQ